MHRNATLREFNEHFDSLLPDQESLLIQLCDHLFRSGFVFEDASETEIEAGGWVIRDFFDQEADVLRVLVPRDRFVNFSEYVKKFDWPAELLQKKLSQRILIAFPETHCKKTGRFGKKFRACRNEERAPESPH